MNCTFEEYMKDVRSQLECNRSAEDKAKYGCYTYSEQTVNENLDYFMDCLTRNIGTYTALLFLQDYLQDKK